MIAPNQVDFGELSNEVNNFIQATADGKNTIYRQAAEPVGGTYVIGDLWFDTDNDNAISRWELVGATEQWNPFGLGNAAIANLNAGKITTGTLSAIVTITGSLQAGSGAATFFVKDTGIYFGSATFSTAPFQVSASGELFVGTSPNWLRVNNSGQVWTGGVSFADAEFRIDTTGDVRIGPRRDYATSAVTPSSPAVGSVTYTTTATHTLVAGDAVTISGLAPAGYNGTFVITAVTSNTIRVANTETGTVTDAVGTIASTALFISNSGGITIGTAAATGEFKVSPTGQVDVGGTDATSFHIAPQGNVWVGAGPADFDAAPFKLSNDGSIDIGGDDNTSLHISTLGNIHLGAAKASAATAPLKINNDGSLDVGGDDATSLHIAVNGNVYSGVAKGSSATAPFLLTASTGAIKVGTVTGSADIATPALTNVIQLSSTVYLANQTIRGYFNNGAGAIYAWTLNASGGFISTLNGASMITITPANVAGALISLSAAGYNSTQPITTTSDVKGSGFYATSVGSQTDPVLKIATTTDGFYTDGTHPYWANANQGSKIWTAGNDGAGSGLDADKLDNLQASQFLRSDVGDTMTGQLAASSFFMTGTLSTSTAAQAGWGNSTTGGTLCRFTSAARYKRDIVPLVNSDLDPKRLLDVEIVQFKYKDEVLIEGDKRKGMDIPGFVADTFIEKYPIVCDVNDDGEAEGWSTQIIIPPMLALIQDLYKEIEELKQKVATL